MANRRASDAAPPANPIAPVIKRKRRASCLGEQERRERKRAIDREAQRSLREKTKTHIAELERTIQILRDQDRNGATASLLSEIDGLRAENERLRDVIDSVKSVVGSEVFPRASAGAVGNGAGGSASPPATSGGQNSPNSRTDSTSIPKGDQKPALPSPPEHTQLQIPHAFEFNNHHLPSTSRTVDLDGMTVMTDLTTDPSLNGLPITLESVTELPESDSLLDVPESPATASFAPYMAEIFGPSWRCPSPIVLHIDSPPPATINNSNAMCPLWKKSNELFGKVFNFRPGTAALNTDIVEAGLLYLGIKQGWASFNEWMQSPALKILKEVDELLFSGLPKTERLATSYKSFKLLKYYLNATKEELEKVPDWLRPSPGQARTKHPIAIDFFAWPTLRERLVHKHGEIFQTQELSHSYSAYIKFDWPFSFEDAFFYDDSSQAFYPSPLFERYHRDLKYWTVADEFYRRHPEMRADIEGDRRRFCEVGS